MIFENEERTGVLVMFRSYCAIYNGVVNGDTDK